MSRFLLIPFTLLTAAIVSTSVFAAPLTQGNKQVAGRLDVQAAAKEVALRQAVMSAQQQERSSSGDGKKSNGNEIADPAYEAEVQAITGKRMTTVYTTVPPNIDGVPNEPEWNLAEPVSDFFQREPDNGQPGSERTEVRMLYDDEALYFAFYCYDSEPDKIMAMDLRRDSRMNTDDTIAVGLDPYHDRRSAFVFRVNPLGTRFDVEVRDERNINADWDERWDAKTTITDEGWFAEFRIPLSSLSYRTGSHVWGIDFKREVRRKNEEHNWSNYKRGFQLNAVSFFGNLVGLRNLKMTKRFRFQPYAAGSGSRYNLTSDPSDEADGSAGVENFKIRITPNLTADFSANTDFAQVEDDTERVNLTRFPLFFPEKREFFRDSSSDFSFGSGGYNRGGGYSMRAPTVSLYHSRNIGMENGEPVPMLYGAKITGKLGSTNLGFMNAQTGDSKITDDVIGPSNPGKNFSVLRLKQDVFRRSSIGLMLTNTQGDGKYNRVGGVDANFVFYDFLTIGGEIASVLADDSLEADAELDDNPITARFGAGWNSDQWVISGNYQRIDADFQTDLGFISRRDIASQNYRVGWNPRPSFAPSIRQVRFSGSFNYLTDVEGNFLEQKAGLNTSVNFQSGDRVTFNISKDLERLERIFFISVKENIFALPGDYRTQGYSVNFDSVDSRTVSGRMNVSWNEYWGGTRYSLRPGGTLRFNENFSLSPSYSYNHIEMPTGVYDTHTVTARVTYNFNARWLTNSLVQYNSVSGRASVYARLRYVINEIDSFYFVYKSTRTWDEAWDGIADHQLIAKMTYSIDF